MSRSEGRLLPDREIAYSFTVAMLFAQEMEVNLRAILHTIDYSLEDLADTLTPSETKRFNTFERFLEKATTGPLKKKMSKAGIKWTQKAWDTLDEACTTRNELAHEYLERLPLPPPTGEHHKTIVQDLQKRAVLLYSAMLLTRVTREKIEKMSDEQHVRLNEMAKEFGIELSGINKGLWKYRKHTP